MLYRSKNELLPVHQGWGILLALSSHKQDGTHPMTQSHENLESLIAHIGSGDEVSLERLYDATVNRVYSLALKIVNKPELAEEVVGDVYMQVWKKAQSYDATRLAAIGWLLMICRSRALDKLRREKSATRNQYQSDAETGVDYLDEQMAMPFESMMQGEISTQVSAALQILSKTQRQVLALAFYRDMSHQQIATYTNLPLGTVKSNIRRAQDVLRNVLDKDNLNTGGLYGEA